MANHKSATKRARQSITKNLRNRAYISKVRTVVKDFRTAASELQSGKGEASKVQELFVSAQSIIQKAAKKGLLHKNTASRKVSRLSKLMVKK